MGESNILAGEALESAGACTWIRTPLGTFPVPGQATPGKRVKILARPEHIEVASAADTGAISLGAGSVTEAVFQGTHLRLRLNAGPQGSVPITAARRRRLRLCDRRPLGGIDPIAEPRSATGLSGARVSFAHAIMR